MLNVDCKHETNTWNNAIRAFHCGSLSGNASTYHNHGARTVRIRFSAHKMWPIWRGFSLLKWNGYHPVLTPKCHSHRNVNRHLRKSLADTQIESFSHSNISSLDQIVRKSENQCVVRSISRPIPLPFLFFALTTEGSDGPNGTKHFLGHCTRFGKRFDFLGRVFHDDLM